MQKALAILALCIATLTLLPATIPAITFYRRSGRAVQRHSISGVVVHVDQDRRSFTLQWVSSGKSESGTYHFGSSQQSFRVWEGTAYKNDARENMVKGARVRITGRRDVAGTVADSFQRRFAN
jgi:hypothetical protein